MTEYAAGSRGGPMTASTFPERWGRPPGDPTSRAHWVALHVRGAHPLLPGTEVRQRLSPREALAQLVQRDLQGRLAHLESLRRDRP